jgi:hypothetical protein
MLDPSSLEKQMESLSDLIPVETAASRMEVGTHHTTSI